MNLNLVTCAHKPVIPTEVEESLNVVWPLQRVFAEIVRCLPFGSLRSLRAGSQFGASGAINWMQRHVAARHDSRTAPPNEIRRRRTRRCFVAGISRNNS